MGLPGMVFDAAAHQVTQYVDGMAVSRQKTRFELPLHIGNADLGNWSVGTYASVFPVRHFSGRMDEFSAYGRALSDREIRDLYELGSPKSNW